MTCFQIWSLVISIIAVLAAISGPIVRAYLNYRRHFKISFIVSNVVEIDKAQLRIDVKNPNIKGTKYIAGLEIDAENSSGKGKYGIPYHYNPDQYETTFDNRIVVNPLQIVRLPEIQIDGNLRRDEVIEGTLFLHLTDESGKTKSYNISKYIQNVVDKLKEKEKKSS